MARGRPDPEREEWVQSNTEFHRDWTARENQGDSLGWKQGLSIEPSRAQRPKKYSAQVAPRRPRRWFLWLVTAALSCAAIWIYWRS